jgi:hypothetical protein
VPQLSYGPSLPRAPTDRPDDEPGTPQIHFVYVLPSDGADRAFDTSGAISNSVASFETWLSTKTQGRTLRVDTSGGSLDISYLRLTRTDAEIASDEPIVTGLHNDLVASGFDTPNKIYAIYYDGTSSTACGTGEWPGNYVALYLKGLPQGPVPCDSNPFAGAGGMPAYREFSMLHELMHAHGIVAPCAPNYQQVGPGGHVADDANDLMWAGTGSWVPSGWASVYLDKGNDDYFRAPIPGCVDLDESPYLTPEQTFADVPPSHPFYDEIEELHALGITNGCGTNQAGQPIYCPDQPVTRRDMAVFIVRALGLTPLDSPMPTFADVPAGMFGYGQVERFFAQGITTGCAASPARYCPLATVTRRDMAVFIVRAKGLSPLDPSTPTFADIPASMFGFGQVERFYEQGITTGCAASPLRYCPLAVVDRKAMAAFLVRAFGPAPG